MFSACATTRGTENGEREACVYGLEVERWLFWGTALYTTGWDRREKQGGWIAAGSRVMAPLVHILFCLLRATPAMFGGPVPSQSLTIPIPYHTPAPFSSPNYAHPGAVPN